MSTEAVVFYLFAIITVGSAAEVGPVMQRLRGYARQNFPALEVLAKRMFLGSVETGLVEARISALGLPGQRDKLLDAGHQVAGLFADLLAETGCLKNNVHAKDQGNAKDRRVYSAVDPHPDRQRRHQRRMRAGHSSRIKKTIEPESPRIVKRDDDFHHLREKPSQK